MSEPSMPLQRPITILGAGIGGLTLGQCLRQKGIPSILYEKVSASEKRHSYGITLHPSSCERLSGLLGLDSQSLRQQTAVDRLYHDGVGLIQPEEQNLSTRDPPGSFRANRARLEELLRKGLDINFDHPIERTLRPGQFTDPSHLVVDALGVHSTLRLSLLPNSTPTVLPYIVFNGRRRISLAEYQTTYAQHFRAAGSTCSAHHPTTANPPGIRLQISINEHHPPPPPSSSDSGSVDISYTYSRPALTGPSPCDPLHNPTRPNASATTIPPVFYAELAASLSLGEPTSTTPPDAFSHTFAPDSVRRDRVLHWLMRSSLLSRGDLSSLAGQSIVVIGDSAHATPILGGHGANAAIRDALELAEAISASPRASSSKPVRDDKAAEHWRRRIETFYDTVYDEWRREVGASERALAEMHLMDQGGV